MDQETTIDPYESHRDDGVEAQGNASTSMPRLTNSKIRWGTLLAVLSIVGNTTVPWLLDDLISTLNRALNRSYGMPWYYDNFFVLYGFGAGLVIAQCVAVWLVCNAYLPSRSGRLLIGSFVNILDLRGQQAVHWYGHSLARRRDHGLSACWLDSRHTA
jgi:hypothetical protein